MASLQTLDIKHNEITSLPQSIKKCQSLCVIDVSYNQLSAFPGDLALHLPQLQSFVIEGNPAHEQSIDESKGKVSKRRKVEFKKKGKY